MDDIDEEYKKIVKEINDQKNYKHKLDNDKQMAFRELEALEKQEE